MSYILDALRKSDQQRQRAAAPTLLTPQPAVGASGRTAFPYKSLLVAFLVGAGVVFALLRPWQWDQHAPSTESIATKPPSSNPHLAAPVPLSALPQVVGKPNIEPLLHESTSAAQPTPASTPPPMQQELTPPTESETRPASSESVSGVANTVAAPTPSKPVGMGPAPNDSENRVMAAGELPPLIQQEIPDMSISFLVYSNNPKDRRVMINNVMLHQGDFIVHGVGLEQITPDGVIISYKGYRFRRGLR
jgi:general secretion pathway protein B